MTTTLPPAEWAEANQRRLWAEFGRLGTVLRESLAGADDDTDGARTPGPATAVPAVEAIAGAFALTPFERDLLLLLAGVEMDSDLAEMCAEAAGHPRGGAITFGLALALLPEPHWSALSPSRPLRRWHLVEVGGGAPLAARGIRIDERVLHHLAGVDAVDSRIDGILRRRPLAEIVSGLHEALAAHIAEEWEPGDRGWPVVRLYGDDPEGREDVAAMVAATMGWRLCVAKGEDLPVAPGDRHMFATLWARESVLSEAVLLVEAGPSTMDAVGGLAEAIGSPLLVGAGDPAPVGGGSRAYCVRRPAEVERRSLWRQALGPSAGHAEQAIDVIASRFAMSARSIAAWAPAVRAELGPGGDPLGVLRFALIRHGAPLDDLTRRVDPVATWSDLVVPDAVADTLREITAQVRHRATVYEEWGFAAQGSRGLGISALFSGESGTGKTMAAEVLANELSLDLYVIDLSAVVSKYIGETEKNLRRVFDAAEDGAILLFDEADALFGKRTEVKDSHDRYANVEVSYLLQRMEAYSGLAILTTNLKKALDRSFQRRLRFFVTFPFPDAALREQIWRGVFPPQTPLGDLDWSRLAELAVAGGSIRTIALNAAFLAAEAAEPVSMGHLLTATRTEYAKLERPLEAVGSRRW